MKITILILIISLTQVSASIYSQATKLNVDMKNAGIVEILDEIKGQSEFNFLYRSNLFDEVASVDLKFTDASTEEILNKLLLPQGYSYEIIDNVIVIRKTVEPSREITKQQERVIKGKVSDEDGSPMVGVNIYVKGTQVGTITDVDGNYSLGISDDAQILVFSFVGFQKQEIVVSDQKTEINVVMKKKVAELGEVAAISTGYQKIKPEQSTGSITVIKAKEFNGRINTTDFLTGLENKIPGLLINNDITFEGNSLFQIRGISTIHGERQPLIVVDGFPTELSLDMINPNEIESVTVLKDAAAATVYGVRASNGVVVIERKKAKAGKVNVVFRSTTGFTPKENYDRYRWDKDGSNMLIDYFRTSNTIPSFMWNFMNSPRMGSFFNYPAPGLIMAQQSAGVITEEEANQQYEELGSYNNTKDYGRLFLRTASTQTYNLDISGGDEHALYYITANYTASDLSEIKNDNSRFHLSGRSTVKFSKRFSLDLTMDFQEGKTNSAPIPSIGSIYPYERFQDEDGNPLPLYNSSYANPYYNDAIMSLGLKDNMCYPLVDVNEISNKDHTVNNRITANFRYKIGNGFSLNFGGVYETSRTDTKHLASENSSEVHQYINYYSEDAGDAGVIFNIPEGSFLKQSTSSRKSYTLRAQLNYDKQISKDHSLNLILGGEVRDVLDKSNTAAYFGYNDQTLLQQSVDYRTLLDTYFSATYARMNPRLLYSSLFDQGYTENRYVSIYHNLVYAYKGKYSFTGSIRIEQSNLFGTNPKYRYKPLWSVGAAWNIHKERFMQDINWAESLKLRIAYGFNGNVAKNALPQIIAEAKFNDLFSVAIPSLNLLSYANSGLRWEQSCNFNIGLDYTIFKNISGSIDYYIKKSTDLMATNQIDASKGGAYALINQASVRNSGLEFSLHADWITRKNFNWNTGLVFSYNSSKILQVYNDFLTPEISARYYVSGSHSNYLEGYAVGAMFNYRYAGLNSKGEILIYDENGNAKTSDFYETTKNDVDYAGSSIPSFNMGLSNRMDIGNFYVYCMINYYGGFKVRVPVPHAGNIRPLEGADNYWKEPGDENNPDVLPMLGNPYASHLGYTDKYVVNGAYITLGDLTASYSFRDSKLVKEIGISNLEVRLQASNVYTVALNKYNYSVATGSYAKSYLTPTYIIALYVNF